MPDDGQPGRGGEQRQRTQHARGQPEDRHPRRCARRSPTGTTVPGDAEPLRRRAAPPLPRRHRAGHRRPRRDLGVLPDPRTGQQGAPRPDGRAGADLHPAQVQHVTVQPVAGEVDLALDRAAGPEAEQAGDRRQRVQVDVGRDGRAEHPRVVGDPRRARQVLGAERVSGGLGGPQPQVHRPAARVRPGPYAVQQRPGGGGRQGHPPRRADQQQPPGQHPPPGDGRRPRHGAGPAEHVVRDREPQQPAQPDEGRQRDRDGGLHQPGRPRCRCDAAMVGRHRRRELVEGGGEAAQPRVLVDVGDGHLGEPGAQCRHQPGGRQAAAAVLEEVVVQAAGRRRRERRSTARPATPPYRRSAPPA